MICQQIEHGNLLVLCDLNWNTIKPEVSKMWVYSTSVIHSTSECYNETNFMFCSTAVSEKRPGGFTVAQTGSSFSA